jgi:hypothetical protein
MISQASGDGAVAVYRWFDDGEGWAFHPWFSARGTELSHALDGVLKSAPAGEFCIPALDGFLVGEHCEDLNCADPKAQGRRPTLLRAVFLLRCPDAGSRKDLLEALRAVDLPRQRRQDPQLKIADDVRNRLTFEAPVERNGAHKFVADAAIEPQTSRHLGVGLILLLVIGAAIALMVGVLGFAFLGFHAADANRSTSPASPIQSSQPPADTSSSTSPGSLDNNLESLTATRFRKALGPQARLDHPYVAFLKAQAERLPETERVYQNRAELPKLLLGFTLRDNLSDDALADALTEQMQYERWREASARREFQDRDKPLPEELRRFVERFRRPTPGFRRAAVQMAQMVRGWGEPEPSEQFAEQQPFTVIDRFFAFLTRPRSLPRPLMLDHPTVAFLWRLPADPIAEGQTFDRDPELAGALRRLLYHLEGEAARVDAEANVPALLARIEKAMNYRDWCAAGKRTYVDAERGLPDEVVRFARRFEK